MKAEEIKECLELLTKAIERVTINTAGEQGLRAAGEVLNIVDKVKNILGIEPPEIKNCSNCKNLGESICKYCVSGIRGSTPSHWERED